MTSVGGPPTPTPRYRVQSLVFESGERFSLLIDRKTGIPLFNPTLYSLNELRASNRASASISQANRSIMVLTQSLESDGIDLGERLSQGQLLSASEIDSFLRLCYMPQGDIDALQPVAPNSNRNTRRQHSREGARMNMSAIDAPKALASSTASIRFHYGGAYIVWCARRQILRLGQEDAERSGLAIALAEIQEAFKARLAGGRREGISQRKGLPENQAERLLAVAHPISSENPWKGKHVRARNYLIVAWLINLGVRIGELLGLRVSDVNFQSNEVVIARRADEKLDPRKYQPNTKTNDRLLGLSDDLANLTREYVLKYRKAQGRAKGHPYLFVANGSGAPLTLVAVTKLFRELRAKCPGLPVDLSPHLLRHTWNDRFSEEMDKRRVEAAEEERLREYQMGWKSGSKSAKTYTRRHVERKAMEAGRNLQAKHRVQGVVKNDASK